MEFLNYLSVIDFQVNSIVVWKPTLYDFHSFKFVKVCLMAQNVVSLGEYSIWASEKCVFFRDWLGYSINVILFKQSDSPDLVNYILADFLLSWSLNHWEGCVQPPTKIVNLLNFFLLVSSVFASYILTLCCWIRTHLALLCLFWRIDSFMYVILFFNSDNLSWSEVCFVWSWYDYFSFL